MCFFHLTLFSQSYPPALEQGNEVLGVAGTRNGMLYKQGNKGK